MTATAMGRAISLQMIGKLKFFAALTGIFLYSGEAMTDGRSVFDQFFLDTDQKQAEYNIPFPFSRLVEVLEQQLGMSINNDPNVAKTTLIPLGRCINRYVAAPEYFKYPRIVVAIDSEHNGPGEWKRPFIKDKLFLGYQEKADAIEVISYNEQKGEFDFQVVSNYSAGNTPSVRTIKDNRCVSCHQNRGPIFSRSNWDETEFNPEIFRRIATAKFGPGYQSSRTSASGAASVDLATNRANMFSLFQRFWQDGCRSRDQTDETRCRAGLFQMALEHRLQESNRTLIPPKMFTDYLIPISSNNAALYWPDGISFPSSDIKNQNPLRMGEIPHLNSAEELKQPRPFMIKWNPENIFRVVEGLGDFFPLTDVRKLDQILFDIPQQTASSHINFRGTCRMRRIDKIRNSDDENIRSGDISVRCNLTEGALSSGVGFYADFHVEAGAIKSV
ncbi:MAG: hypothetical protein ACR2QW_15045, partial [bacterium]